MMANDALKQMLRDVLAPLAVLDGGEVYLVAADDDEVSLHLAGRLGGSPATVVVTRRIVEPAVKAVLPDAKLIVTSGWRVPEDAEKIEAS